jgi:galactoside O-acetyltransferase
LIGTPGRRLERACAAFVPRYSPLDARVRPGAGPPGVNGPFDGRRFAFAACGDDVTIYEWVRVLAPERIECGNHVIVDDFVFIDGKGGVRIGSYIHIAGFSSLIGGGRLELGDFCGLSAGCRIVSGTEVIDGSGLTGPPIPPPLRTIYRGYVTIGEHAFLGTNVVVHPDVTIGEGAVVGSGSLVTRDVEPWTVNVGTPARAIKERPRETVLRLAAELRATGAPGEPA